MRWASLVCLLTLLLAAVDVAAQQQGTIRGTVTDDAGAPLPGAQVTIEGTSLGSLANQAGEFLIPGVPVGEQTVRAAVLGYGTGTQDVTVAAGQTAVADFVLGVEALELEGLVAVGYGTQRRVNVTGSVAAVNAEEMAELPVPSVSQALQGLAPGLQVVDQGGLPGGNSASILVRGQGTLGRGDDMASQDAARPLVLIDGFEGDMDAVNVDDIESISVLKDASSAAIYGSRAANGVILITTKRGAAIEGVQISYDGFYGMQDITSFPEEVSIADHMRLTNVAYVNAGREPKYSQEYIERTLSGEDPINYPTTDWVDLLFNAAPIQDHSVRVSGGTEAARFALSANAMLEDGLMPNTGADRYSIRLNTDFDPTERLNAGLDVSGTRRSRINPSEVGDALFFLIHDTPPTVRAQYPDGTWGFSDTKRNPLVYAEESGERERTTWQGTVTGRLNYELVPEWLDLQTSASLSYNHYNNEEFRTEMQFPDYFDPNTIVTQWGPNQLWRDVEDTRQTTLRALLNYQHDFGDDHFTSGLLGYEQIDEDVEWFGADRQDFYNNELRQIDLGNAEFDNNWGGAEEWALRSVFGRFSYSYQGKYLFEANARYDGSSRFAEGNRFGFFPSFSAAWRVSEESFFDLDWVDELKLRGSWGQLGNQDVGLYQYYSTIALDQPYYFGGQLHTGGSRLALTNEDISWETTTVTDFGVDAAFLAGRLSLSADVYRRRTDDILLNLPIPDIVGLNAPTVNAGVVENRGWEVALGWQDQATDDFSYSIDVNLSDNINEVIDLAGTGPYVGWDDVIMEGQPINAWYMYDAVGLFQSQEEIDAHATQAGNTHPGDVKWKDQNNDGVINEADKVVVGSPHPRYMFGVNLAGRWRNFDAGLFVQGVGKRDQRIELGLAEGPMWENFTTSWHLDYWTPDNPDARVPAPYIYENHSTHYPSDWWLTDASFAKLRNVQLGYTLPTNQSESFGISRLRVYVSGKNLWQTSGMDIGLDPEVAAVRGDFYPQTRVISIGTDVTF